jgi:hypothetical protein
MKRQEPISKEWALFLVDVVMSRYGRIIGVFCHDIFIMIFIRVHIKINVVDRHSPTHLPNTEDVFWRNVVAQTSHTKPCVLSHGLKFCVMTKTLHRSSSHVVNHSELGVQKR